MNQLSSTVRLLAWKYSGNNGLTPCEWGDGAAVRFDVLGAAAQFGGGALEFADRAMAERVAFFIEGEFEAGKRAAKAELRAWLD